MAEFQSIMKDYRRMCDEYLPRNCDGCPLANEVCRDVIIFKSDKAEEIIMDWAAAHPEPQYPTWKEWQTGTFPKHGINAQICPRCFLEVRGCIEVKGCDDCYNERIPAEIAEKLGIKPKEVK